MAAREHCLGDLGMPIGAFELKDGIAVPVDPEPAQPREDRVDRGLSRARPVGILDPQQEFAAMMTRKQPVKQRGARAAQVEDSRSAKARTG